VSFEMRLMTFLKGSGGVGY